MRFFFINNISIMIIQINITSVNNSFQFFFFYSKIVCDVNTGRHVIKILFLGMSNNITNHYLAITF